MKAAGGLTILFGALAVLLLRSGACVLTPVYSLLCMCLLRFCPRAHAFIYMYSSSTAFTLCHAHFFP